MDCKTATLKSLLAYVGGLSKPSKMPGYSYGLPTNACKVGAKLKKIPGSTCASCYADKGFYKAYAHSVVPSQYRKLEATTKRYWVPAMVRLIGHYSPEVFRWHDSGDIQDLQHLRRIAMIAEALPNTKFWIPTREVDMVRKYQELWGQFPENLVVRISAFFAGTNPPKYKLPVVQPTSTVHKPGEHVVSTNGLECQAYRRDGQCGACRACWSPKVKNVSYPAH